MTIAEQFEANKGRFEVDLQTQHHFSGGVYAKQMRLPAGYMAISHQHNYDHMSVLASGVVEVATDAGKTVYHGPAVVEIKAGMNHAITAIEDATWFCIHATEVCDPSEVDKVLIKES